MRKLLRFAVHILGLSCLGAMIFVQTLIFLSIFSYGYFLAVEPRPIILYLELTLTAFTAAYFFSLFMKQIKGLKQK